MLAGTGEATVAVAPAVAFAYLADARHAQRWFAGAGFAVPPEGPPREGQSWSFARTAGTRRVLPARMSVYQPPDRFVWETQRGPLATNNIWELHVVPVPAVEGTAMPAETLLRLTIRLRPGPLGWLATLPLLPILGRTLTQRAQRAVERAAEAVRAEANAPHRAGQARRKGKRGTQR